MDDANVRFVELASPHSWLRVADNLHGQALHLYSRQDQSATTLEDFKNSVRKTWDDTNRSVFLLGGFALENAIKAFLVYENPNWISNGKLSRLLKSHSLTSLQKQSSLIPFKNRYIGVLRQFEEGLESWARYPCSVSAVGAMDEPILQPDLWQGYTRLMRAYGNRMKKLLSSSWHGPHGYYARYEFRGEFLNQHR